MKPFTFKDLFEEADYILGKRDFMWWCKEYESKILYPDSLPENLEQASILFLYGGAFDDWVKRFQVLDMKCKLLILGACDETYTNARVQKLLQVLPETEFWITNWIGNHPRCSLLPLLANYDGNYSTVEIKKQNLFGITYSRVNSPARVDFYQRISQIPEVHPYFMKEVPNHLYYNVLGSLYFSCCPMGGGLDTYRFWESLLVGAIPVVKHHFFYECLKRYYPNIPMIIIEEWEDLPKCIEELSIEKYEQLMKESNVEVLFPEFWKKKLMVMHNSLYQNTNSNEYKNTN